MNLFENEIININKIHTVNLYEFQYNTAPILNYSANLYSYELIFFSDADNVTHFCGNTIKDSPDSIRYLPKGKHEGSYIVEKKKDTSCIDIYFDTDTPMPDFAIGLYNMKELKSLFIKIYNVWNSKRPGYYTEAMFIFYEIINKIKKHTDKYFTSSNTRKIIPSYNYMLDNFTNPKFDYRLMAEKSGLSYDYFKELFIKQFKMSPVKYITNLRIEKAKELLLTGQFSVTEIADLCGFENVYYFSTVFKKITGIPPTNHKKRI